MGGERTYVIKLSCYSFYQLIIRDCEARTQLTDIAQTKPDDNNGLHTTLHHDLMKHSHNGQEY